VVDHALVRKYGKLAVFNRSRTIHPHTFRLSFTIHLVRFGLDLRRVQLLLGHSNLNTTSTYLKFKTADLLEMYNRIEF
jgi:integrase/recombinase XerC